LAKTTFTLPGDGEDNANGFIGPICCTGETARVETSCGYPVGFFHYIFFDETTEPFSRSPRLDVTGSLDVLNPRAPQEEVAVNFFADVDGVGTKKTVTAGELVYTLTLLEAEKRMTEGVLYFASGLVVGYELELTAAAKERVAAPGAHHLPYCGTGACERSGESRGSCDVPACDACRLELPEVWRGNSCAESLGLHIEYTYGWNSNAALVGLDEDCETSWVHVTPDRDAIEICPRNCDHVLTFAESITLESACP
jgi:hypothetical protein